VKLAIEYLEAGNGPRPIYGGVTVVGMEAGRAIISLPTYGTIPPARRFLAVADDTATFEELDFGYVSSRHGVRGYLM
jgi:hypothetical protein